MSIDLASLGADGWEMCGFAAADKTLGFNALVAVFKRPGIDSPPPADRAPAWQPDPQGVAPLRWWDGSQWTRQTHE